MDRKKNIFFIVAVLLVIALLFGIFSTNQDLFATFDNTVIGKTTISHASTSGESAARLSPFYLDVVGEVQDNEILLTYTLGEITEVVSPEETCPNGGTEDCGVYIAGPVTSFATDGSLLTIQIPDGLMLTDGKSVWSGNLEEGDVVTLTARLAPTKDGVFEIVTIASAGKMTGYFINTDVKEKRTIYVLVKGTKIYLNTINNWCSDRQTFDESLMECIRAGKAMPVEIVSEKQYPSQEGIEAEPSTH